MNKILFSLFTMLSMLYSQYDNIFQGNDDLALPPYKSHESAVRTMYNSLDSYKTVLEEPDSFFESFGSPNEFILDSNVLNGCQQEKKLKTKVLNLNLEGNMEKIFSALEGVTDEIREQLQAQIEGLFDNLLYVTSDEFFFNLMLWVAAESYGSAKCALCSAGNLIGCNGLFAISKPLEGTKVVTTTDKTKSTKVKQKSSTTVGDTIIGVGTPYTVIVSNTLVYLPTTGIQVGSTVKYRKQTSDVKTEDTLGEKTSVEDEFYNACVEQESQRFRDFVKAILEFLTKGFELELRAYQECKEEKENPANQLKIKDLKYSKYRNSMIASYLNKGINLFASPLVDIMNDVNSVASDTRSEMNACNPECEGSECLVDAVMGSTEDLVDKAKGRRSLLFDREIDTYVKIATLLEKKFTDTKDEYNYPVQKAQMNIKALVLDILKVPMVYIDKDDEFSSIDTYVNRMELHCKKPSLLYKEDSQYLKELMLHYIKLLADKRNYKIFTKNAKSIYVLKLPVGQEATFIDDLNVTHTLDRYPLYVNINGIEKEIGKYVQQKGYDKDTLDFLKPYSNYISQLIQMMNYNVALTLDVDKERALNVDYLPFIDNGFYREVVELYKEKNE